MTERLPPLGPPPFCGTRAQNLSPHERAIEQWRERILFRAENVGVPVGRWGLRRDAWWQEVARAEEDIARVVPRGSAIVLVDDATWALTTVRGRPVVPFPERDGRYRGLPADGEEAVAELERVRAAGARHLAVAAPSLWWLDHYDAFARALERTARRVFESERVLVFELDPPSGARPAWRPVPRHRRLRNAGRTAVERAIATPAVQRLVPDRLALGLALVGGRVAWLHRPTRERARAQVALTLAGTRREREVDAVARRQIGEVALRGACWFRTWMFFNTPVVGLEHLDDAVARGRGVVLTTPHLGPLHALVRPLMRRGYFLHILAGEWLRDEAGGGYQSYKQRITTLAQHGADRFVFIYRGGAFARLRELLERGETCFVAFDVPGHHETRFLGKRTRIAHGAGHLAFAAGSPIVIGVVRRRRLAMRAEFLPPIEPSGFPDGDALVAHVAAVLGDLVLEQPAAFEPVAYVPLLWPDESAPHAWAFWPGEPPPEVVAALASAEAPATRSATAAGRASR